MEHLRNMQNVLVFKYKISTHMQLSETISITISITDLRQIASFLLTNQICNHFFRDKFQKSIKEEQAFEHYLSLYGPGFWWLRRNAGDDTCVIGTKHCRNTHQYKRIQKPYLSSTEAAVQRFLIKKDVLKYPANLYENTHA